jgi:tRNA pseudouridine55 synthase
MNEIIVVNKEKGLTSRDVVNKLCRILNTKKIGHTGTLDPIASGVLVCLVGKYTKLVDMITALEKEYIAEIKLGIKTDTLDITGEIIEKNNDYNLNEDIIIKVLNSFLGSYEQTVPLYSAISINGERLYKLARDNKKVVLPKREVNIKEIELLNYDNNIIKFRVVVSKGTYVRSLIRDICDKLNVLGTMNSLVRTKQGIFNIDNSYTLEDIQNNKYQDVKLNSIISLKEVEVEGILLNKVLNGNIINYDYDGYILFKSNNQDIALYYFVNKEGRLKILF